MMEAEALVAASRQGQEGSDVQSPSSHFAVGASTIEDTSSKDQLLDLQEQLAAMHA